jgi:hypothetical protein
MRGKNGALEMSIGTIVVIVLSMSMLILGIVLIKNIFGGAMNVADMTDAQISAELEALFGSDRELSILPNVKILEAEIGESTAFAIRIKNLVSGGGSGAVLFDYEIIPDNFDGCGVTANDILGWMKGHTGAGIPIATGGDTVETILLRVPEGAPLCEFKVRVNVKQNGVAYATQQMFIETKG